MPNELEFLQSLSERELCELVILPLLSAQGFEEIRYTHGKLESGRDIVFSSLDPLAGRITRCAAVKRTPLTGAVTGSRAIREVHYQVKQALTQPYLNPFDGQQVFPKSVYVITPFVITNEASESIKGELHALGNHVFFIDGAMLLTLVQRHVPDLLRSLTNVDLRYLHQLQVTASELSQIATTPGQPKMSLKDLYTGGKLIATTKAEARLGSFGAPLAREDNRDVELSLMLSTHPYLTIISDAGAGKSTCLKRIALDLIEAHISEGEQHTALMPLLIPLHRLSPGHLVTVAGCLSQIAEYLRTDYDLEMISLDALHKYALLLDGFDEIPEQHGLIAQAIDQLIPLFPQVIVTSRPSRVPDFPSSRFAYASLVPFSDDDMKVFLTKWFGLATQADAIMTKIRSDESLLNFCRSPLLLTMYAGLASRRSLNMLPGRRTEVYEQVVSLLVDEWDRMRGLVSNFDADEKHYALEALAFSLHCQRSKTFDLRAFSQVVRPFLEARGKGERVNELLDEIIFRTSLVRPVPRSSSLEFAHFSFQEFFAAEWARRALNKADIQALMFDEWWRNAIRFYCGLTRSMDGLVPKRKMLSRGKLLWLGEYLTEADFTSSKYRNQILGLLEYDIASFEALDMREIEYASRAGNELIARLAKRLTSSKRLAANSDGFTSFHNFLRLLVVSDTALARETARQFLDQFHKINTLNRENLAECIALCGRRSFRDAIWLKWCLVLIKEFERASIDAVQQILAMPIKNDQASRLRVMREANAEGNKDYSVLVEFSSWLQDAAGDTAKKAAVGQITRAMNQAFDAIKLKLKSMQLH